MSSSDAVRASHILIKHEGSRNKSSLNDPKGINISKTTKESAIILLNLFRDVIKNGDWAFENLAFRCSDCNSAKYGGDLGYFGRGKMQKPFEDAAFDLKVGEISDIVDTASGVHIIKRTA